jgi:TfoX/Sxy family transcriptional regulator of competence genes
LATKQATVDYLLDQASGAGDVSVRKMFGEYGMHCDDKFVALLCDDRFFVKSTPEGLEHLGPHDKAPPYPGAKDYPVVPEERWEDSDFMAELIRLTAAALPAPKPKKKKAL